MKLTPWFPGTVKPVRPGVYQRIVWCRRTYSFWDGQHWHAGTESPKPARYVDRLSDFQASAQWRGIRK